MSEQLRLPETREIDAVVMLVRQERLAEAEKAARGLLARHPEAGILWKILGVAQLRQGKDALDALQRAAQLSPEDAEVHRNLGGALYDRGRWSAALASFQRALALDSGDASGMVDAANSLRALRRAAEAVPLYRQALRLEPRNVEARNNLGNAFLELGRHPEAADSYQQALQLKPDDPQVLSNLGNALWRVGRLDEALSACRRAVAIAPGLDVAHNAMGLALASAAERERAADSFRQALRLNPRYAEAHNNLGDVLRDLGARVESLNCYARAVECDPARPESHCKLGNALFELRRVPEAMACYARAIALDARHLPAHVGLAAALRQQKQPDEAQASCRAALGINPDDVEALTLAGELEADRGRFAEAERLFRHALELKPDLPSAYASIATHRRMTADDERWYEGARALLGKPLPLAQQINLRYALGKYSDDLGHYESAFGHYREANELTKRLGPRYDGARFSALVDRIRALFDAELLRRLHAQGHGSALPAFVVGMPRSGTSLAEQILASHPSVHGAGELTWWQGFFGQFTRRLREGRDPAGAASGLTQEALARLTALAPDALRVIDKMPSNFLYLGLIHGLFPAARIIHMRRHPADTCLSIYFQNFFNIGPYANDLADLAHYYRQYQRIMAHWRALLPSTALLEVPYEALVADSESWSRRMVEFLGLPWDERCLAFHETERVVVTASKWQVRQKISQSSVGRWQHYENFIGPLGLLT